MDTRGLRPWPIPFRRGSSPCSTQARSARSRHRRSSPRPSPVPSRPAGRMRPEGPTRGSGVSFVAWAGDADVPRLPAAPADVAEYLTALVGRGVGIATVRQAVSAIGAAHRAAGTDSPTESEVVRLTMSGLSRQNRRPAVQAPALLDDAVEAILATARSPRDGIAGAWRVRDGLPGGAWWTSPWCWSFGTAVCAARRPWPSSGPTSNGGTTAADGCSSSGAKPTRPARAKWCSLLRDRYDSEGMGRTRRPRSPKPSCEGGNGAL